MVQGLYSIATEEGWQVLFKGLGPACAEKVWRGGWRGVHAAAHDVEGVGRGLPARAAEGAAQ